MEFYKRTGVDVDGALGWGIAIGSYARSYPATKDAACNAVLISNDYAWFVRRYFKEPSGWWSDYCKPYLVRTGPKFVL